ncbi:MAG: bifunctional phosphopantothenoylcysteine decarboxylase/phosphopantothenate--cysteine ligase CoaBC [Clostridiales bacterium]|nr:bifunctional phosphopantothenoylcysteine decarboxylase/phosphopantothenate--cysteine ligase CoaBC [Clostridiales bacterium]
MKNVVLGVTGGIACYKSCEIVSRLKKLGFGVDVIMTQHACEFVQPLTFETLSSRPVVTDMFDRKHPWEVEHISLAKKASVFVIAPATANIIGKLANGIADDMLSTTAMATKSKIIIAPAMNTNMYENLVVQENMQKLKQRGYIFVEPVAGRLACGDVGKGKMAEPIEIVEKVKEVLSEKQDLLGKKILVSSGATSQPIDGVRCITNYSSGKMGCAIAQNAADRGAEVTLVLGLHSCKVPDNVKVINVGTTDDMFEAVKENYQQNDVVIMAAAPSDYKPVQAIKNKLKGSSIELKLEKNVDIAKYIGENKTEKQTLVIFAAETENLIENAKGKLKNKRADMVVANDVTKEGAGFNVDTNIATFISANEQKSMDKMTKDQLAVAILDEVLRICK